MMTRGMTRTMITGGMIAAVGFLLTARRRRRSNMFMQMTRKPFSLRGVTRIGRFLTRAVAR